MKRTLEILNENNTDNMNEIETDNMSNKRHKINFISAISYTEDIIYLISRYVNQEDFKNILVLNKYWRKNSKLFYLKSKRIQNEDFLRYPNIYSDSYLTNIFSDLSFLDLSDNLHNLNDGMMNLNELKTLVINNNVINDEGLNKLSKLENLFILPNNKNPILKVNITGEGLKDKKLLKLSCGNVSIDMTNLKNSCKSLTYLKLDELSECVYTNDLLKVFTNLKYLGISGENVDDNLIDNFKEIEVLDLINTRITGSSFKNKNIKSLILYDTRSLNLSNLIYLSNSLEHLDIGSNAFSNNFNNIDLENQKKVFINLKKLNSLYYDYSNNVSNIENLLTFIPNIEYIEVRNANARTNFQAFNQLRNLTLDINDYDEEWITERFIIENLINTNCVFLEGIQNSNENFSDNFNNKILKIREILSNKAIKNIVYNYNDDNQVIFIFYSFKNTEYLLDFTRNKTYKLEEV